MGPQVKVPGRVVEDSRFFDGFTKTMLAVGFCLLLVIFATGKYMSAHKMTGVGTDDIVNNLGSAAAHTTHHPFIDLPGDAELSAFSVANFFAGLIVGYNWLRLFGSKPQNSTKKTADG
jgi:cobalt/nickel transport protein